MYYGFACPVYTAWSVHVWMMRQTFDNTLEQCLQMVGAHRVSRRDIDRDLF